MFLFCSSYIFKRLKFLGNKLLSQALALFFLAIWHGLHSGYLVCFQMELLIVIVERQVRFVCLTRMGWPALTFPCESGETATLKALLGLNMKIAARFGIGSNTIRFCFQRVQEVAGFCTGNPCICCRSQQEEENLAGE